MEKYRPESYSAVEQLEKPIVMDDVHRPPGERQIAEARVSTQVSPQPQFILVLTDKRLVLYQCSKGLGLKTDQLVVSLALDDIVAMEWATRRVMGFAKKVLSVAIVTESDDKIMRLQSVVFEHNDLRALLESLGQMKPNLLTVSDYVTRRSSVVLRTENAPESWMGDPTGRHKLRWWDGNDWTCHVSDGVNGTEDALFES